MRRALALARARPARRQPPGRRGDPLAPTGEVIAEGWHRGAGTVHAEVDALSQLSDGAARGATAVVTLEPCNHTGRTGPCSEALIAAGVARVVYAVPDPTRSRPAAADRLRAAGVDVASGSAPDEATDLLESWLDRAAPRPPARDREVGAEPRRPGRGIRRHQPVDHRPRRASGRPPASRSRPMRSSSAPARSLADDPALTARTRRRLALRAPADAGRARRALTFPTDAAVRRHPRPFLHRTRRRSGRPSSPSCASSACSGSSSRAARRSRAPSCGPASSTTCSRTSPRC